MKVRGGTLVGTLAMLALPLSVGSLPVAVFQKTNDSWASDLNYQLDYDACQAGHLVPYEFVSPSAHDESVLRLQRSAAVKLSDAQAAAALEVEPDQTSDDSLATRVLKRRIGKSTAERDAVFATRKGSWSRADDNSLSALRTLVANGYGDTLRPYLIRALAIDSREMQFEFGVRLCAGVLEVSHSSSSKAWLKPDRYALVVFLKDKPKTVVVLTGISVGKSEE